MFGVFIKFKKPDGSADKYWINMYLNKNLLHCEGVWTVLNLVQSGFESSTYGITKNLPRCSLGQPAQDNLMISRGFSSYLRYFAIFYFRFQSIYVY